MQSVKHDAPGQDKEAVEDDQVGMVRLEIKKGGRTEEPDQSRWGV